MKRIVALILAAVLTAGMAVTAFAANPKITRQAVALADVDAGEVAPGDKIFIPLVKDAFEGATEDLTASDVRSSKITIKHTNKAGPKAIESVEIKEDSSKRAGVLITMVDPFTSTKALDFELTFYLYLNGKRQSVGTTVYGTLNNLEEYIYSDSDYVDLSDGVVAKCEETAVKVEAYLGNDVSIFTKMIKNKSYAGKASADPTEDDIDMLNQYENILGVYSLSTTGFDALVGKVVKIETEDDLFVYDGDLNYLGKTSEMLTYSEKYYTSAAKLDVVDDFEEEYEEEYEEEAEEEFEDEEDLSDDTDIPETGSKLPAVGKTTGSINDNPDTGVSALFGLAVMAGTLSLGTAAIACKKKK